jgi:hypothetical protein
MAAAALALARAARAQLQALQPTVEQQQAEIDRVQLRASECGMVEKTAGKSGVAGMIQRGWKKWISSPLGAQAVSWDVPPRVPCLRGGCPPRRPI